MPENVEPTDPLTERLRATVERQTGALPAAPDLPGRIHTRVRRRRRQRLALGTSVVAVALLAVLAGALVLVPGGDSNQVQTADGGPDDRPRRSTTTDDTEPPDTTVPGEPTTAPGEPTTTEPAGDLPVPSSTTLIEPPDGEVLVTADTPLSYYGIGPIRAGMTVYEAEEASGVTINLSASIADEGGCNAGTIGETGVWVLVEVTGTDQKAGVVRIVQEATATEEGLSLGDPVERIDEIYGAPVESLDNPHAAGGQLLVYESGGYSYGFETDGTTVTNLQSGDATWVPLSEGCA